MRRFPLAALVIALAGAAPAAAFETRSAPPEGTVGLVRLPMLFGEGGCSRYDPRPVQLYARRGDTVPIGQIRVAAPWTFPAEGGCSGLRVKSFLHDSPSGEPLPTVELEYDVPAGIVLENIGAWCRIQLRSQAAWIHTECAIGYLPVAEVLRDRSLYLADGAIDLARTRPGAGRRSAGRPYAGPRPAAASLLAVRTIDSEVWLHLAASDVDACGSKTGATSAQQFWLPLHNAAGAVQVWYHARGC